MKYLTEWLLGIVGAYYFGTFLLVRWIFPDEGAAFLAALSFSEFLALELGPLLLAILLGVFIDELAARRKRSALGRESQ